MSDIAIQVDGLGKRYRIGTAQKRHDTLRDTLVDGLQTSMRRLRSAHLSKSTQQTTLETEKADLFWALKDISFAVKRGEVMGVIGRNGAGKSTLLKILSRITEPTEGRAIINGRVGSLLEVGTGFHPELTGRENIYLNGAILGMKRAEIDRKFDEIVAFAEIDKFLDTPVKRYSSGMYVRLAFAVAAHLEPEVLVVDEVLAVGDVAFQRKCLGKMGDIAQAGRTVLFVSHNMGTLQRLCSNSLLIERGRLSDFGPTDTIVGNYLANGSDLAPVTSWIDLSHLSRNGTGRAKFQSLHYSGLSSDNGYMPFSRGPLEVRLSIWSDSDRTVASLAVIIYDQFGDKLINADTVAIGEAVQLRTGLNEVALQIEHINIRAGTYVFGLWLSDSMGEVFDFITSGINFQIVTKNLQGFGVDADGLVVCDFKFRQLASNLSRA